MDAKEQTVARIRARLDQSGAPSHSVDSVCSIVGQLLSGGVKTMGLYVCALSAVAEEYPEVFPRARVALDEALGAVMADEDDLDAARRAAGGAT